MDYSKLMAGTVRTSLQTEQQRIMAMDGECQGEWDRLAADSVYNSRKLAHLKGVTPRQLQRIFRTQFGRSPQEWLNEQRVLAAQGLLRIGAPIKKVSIDLGFKQTSHFCRQFKIMNGLTPTQFKTVSAGQNVAHR